MRSSALLFVAIIVFGGSLMPATVNGQGVFGVGPYTVTQMTNNQTVDYNVQINTSGWLAWSSSEGVDLWNRTATQIVSVGQGIPRGLSDFGDVLWTPDELADDIYVWRNGTNTRIGPIWSWHGQSDPHMNATGTVAWDENAGGNGNISSIRVWNSDGIRSYTYGSAEQTIVEPPAVNVAGQVAYIHVRNDWTGPTQGRVMIDGQQVTAWGNPNIRSARINALGHVVYGETGYTSEFLRVLYFYDGTRTQMVVQDQIPGEWLYNYQVQMNDEDTIVWTGVQGISIWNKTLPICRSLPNSEGGSNPQINSKGNVAWSKSDGIYLWNGFTTAKVASAQNPSAVKLNEKGELAWTASDGNDSEVFFAGPHSPPTPDNAITVQPFTRPAGSTAKNAIVLVHGWKDNPSLFTNDPADPNHLTTTDMKAHIEQALAQSGRSSDWDVFVYDWSTDAANTSGTIAPSESCKSKAGLQGQYLADRLKANGYGVDSGSQVHFVAHSLGGKVIDEATRILSTYKDKQQFQGGIQETFLDAYTPSDWRFKFGEKATYAEHYYYKGNGIEDDPFFGHTADNLTHAYNDDVTWMIDYVGSKSQNHKWPVRFYDNTISSGVPIGGFQYSMESNFYSTWTHPEPNGQQTTTVVKTSINPQESFFGGSETGNYTVTPEHITGSTGSPLWINLLLNTQGLNNYLEFNFAFTSNADGALSVFLDDQLLGQFFEQYAPKGDQSSGKMWFNELLQEGSHLLSFRVDPLTADTSSIDISHIELGYVTAVPEPASIMLLAMALPVWVACHIRRRFCR